MIEYWRLPGARDFLHGISSDLRIGLNSLLIIPRHVPDGWLKEIKSLIRESASPSIEDLTHYFRSPIESLARHVGIFPIPYNMNLTELYNDRRFQARCIQVPIESSDTWDAWRPFLAQYVELCRHYDLSRRTTLLLSLYGEVSPQDIAAAPLLAVRRFNDFSDSMTMKFYASSLMPPSDCPSWQRNLMIQVLSNLSLWDPAVCEEGVIAAPAGILNPFPWLREMGIARSWNDLEALPEKECSLGISQFFEGKRRRHSAWLAVNYGDDAIHYRIWKAEIEFLFPLIEQERRSLLKRHSHYFTVPYNSHGRILENLTDLELNNIFEQLTNIRVRVSPFLRNYAKLLRDIRNQLAHLEPVEPRLLLEPYYSGLMTQGLEESLEGD
jgi:hypothetical protein